MKTLATIAIALVTATSCISAAQPKSVTAAQEWSAYSNEEPTAISTPKFQAQRISKYDAETKKLIAELKTIPVSEYKENYIRYVKLVEYNPGVIKYIDKVAFYKSKIDARKAQERSDAQKRKDSEWSYSISTDEMTSKKIKTAKVISDNEFYFSFPYTGAQSAILMLRKHPRYGNDVLLTIQRGQFMCSTYNNKIMVRFDDGKAQTFRCVEPADHDSTTIFLRGYKRFVALAKRAEKIRIEATIYQQGAPVMEFNTKDLIF